MILMILITNFSLYRSKIYVYATMPRVYAHDVVGGAAENASCCLWRCQYEWPDARGELCMVKRKSG